MTRARHMASTAWLLPLLSLCVGVATLTPAQEAVAQASEEYEQTDGVMDLSGLQSLDVGSVGLMGSTRIEGGVITLQGSGADIWNVADAFQLAALPMSGDVEVVVRVTGMTNTNGWAKAGIMLRESLEPGARHVSLFATPSNGLAAQRRTTLNDSSGHVAAGSYSGPVWLKLVRSGTLFSALRSTDGLRWTLASEVNASFPNTLLVGLALTSHDNTKLGSATFDNLRIRSLSADPNDPSQVEIERYRDISGTTLTSLTSHPRYPDQPSDVVTMPLLDIPVNSADNYGARMRAFIRPPVSGYYTFYLSGDDHSQLFVGEAADPFTKRMVAEVPGWSSWRVYTTYPQQTSAEVWLDADQRYYVEALMKEGGGSDHLTVAWRMPGSAASGPDDVIRAPYVERFRHPRLEITSHFNGEGVFSNGLLLEGELVDAEALDDVQHANLMVLDRDSGNVLAGPLPLSVDEAGLFELPLTGSLYASSSRLRLLLTYDSRLDVMESMTEVLDLDVVPVPVLSYEMGSGLPGWVSSMPDSSGNGRAATSRNGQLELLSGSPALLGDAENTCSYLRMSPRSAYLDAGAVDLKLSSQLTVSGWLRWRVNPRVAGGWSNILSNNSTSKSDFGQFWIQHDSANGKLEFAIQTTSGRAILFSKSAPQQGEWIHVAGTYDGATMRLYVNGVLEASKSWTGTFTYDPTFTLLVGRWASTSNNGRPFEGDLDELRIYDRSLSAGQLWRDAQPQQLCQEAVDSTPPTVSITSHQSGVSVPEYGFFLSGRLLDNQEADRVELTLDDASRGRVLERVPVTVRYPDGSFSFFVGSDQLTPGQAALVTVEGVDGYENRSTQSLQLWVDPVDMEALHLVNRITFGATPEVLAQVQALGADAYLEQQLNPSQVDDSALQAQLAKLTVTDYTSLKDWYMLQLLGSRRHLNEVMTWFWENHFSTQFRKHNNVSYEKNENQAFRQNALGNFRTLLGLSATSPAMMLYLDNASNKKENTNENYARELMELHTLGVSGGYTDQDVAEVARVFTGWRVNNNAFYYDDGRHDQGSKLVLGQTIPANGKQNDGLLVLDLLSRHPSTARFICGKLARFLVSDTPSAETLASCESTFLASHSAPDQVAQVVRGLLKSNQFRSLEQSFHHKLKSPLEFLIGLGRTLNAHNVATELNGQLTAMGMELFGCALPTGYAEVGVDWLSTYQLLERLNYSNRVARSNRQSWNQTTPDYQALLDNPELSPEGLVTYLYASAFQGDFAPAEVELALELLEPTGGTPFDAASSDALTRVRTLYGTVLNFPAFLYQ